MAAPQLMSMIRESTVFEAADNVRETMGETRRYAIDTGIDYEFRYEVSGNNVLILPSELENDVNLEANTSKTTGKYFRQLVELPESIQLKAAEGVEETSERLEPEVFGNLGGNQLSQKSWSTPVLFRFDGTSSNFEIRVTDDSGLTSIVTLRGLTGSARTSQVYQEEN